MRDLNERRLLADYGVHMSDLAVYVDDNWRGDYNLAMDAQPQLVTVANAGIPAFLANIVDPNVIEVVLQPLRAVEIAGGEVKKGDWTSQSLMMPLAEPVGHVVAYGDYDNGGTVDANVNWVSRQPFHYQTIKRIGERQLAMWGVAAIDYNARLDRSVAETFGRFQNRSYFYGISGLANYGMLNDPSLITPITPATKAAGGTTWALATADEIYRDVLALYTQLQTQMGGNLEMTDRIELVLSTTRQPALARLSAFNVSVNQMLAQNFPNLTIRAAPEYSTGSGELMQMIVREYQGEQTIWAAFTEKMRAHPVVQELSAWAQKFSAGTWGAIVRRPIAVAQMLGI
jgi:Uncharacterized protein conserved in bacteria (DUF2184).